MKSWTAEQRAAHGAKIRAAIAKKNTGKAGRLVVLTHPRIAKANRLGTELERAIEAVDLVERIGWDLARNLAGRMK